MSPDPDFSYRLGLDMGTNSIGWATIELDAKNNPVRVDRMGSRIFQNGRDPKTRESLAVKRRQARGIRRGFDRTNRRKQKLLNALMRLDFFPTEKKKQNVLYNTNVYKLRYTALHEAITPHQLGRVIYQLNQHRGFKSNRKEASSNESGLILNAIKETQAKMDEMGYETLGDYLYRGRLQPGLSPKFSATKQKDDPTTEDYNFFPNRAMVETEFELLWERQQTFHANDSFADLFTTANHDLLKDIFFAQRPLKPQQPGVCNFFSSGANRQPRGPLASPHIQQRQLLDRLNNLRYVPTADPYGTSSAPTLEQRNLMLDYMYGRINKKQKAVTQRAVQKTTYEDLRKVLWGSDYDSYRFKQEQLGKPGGGNMPGDAVAYALSDSKLFGSYWQKLPIETQEIVIDLLLSDEDDDMVVDELVEVLASYNVVYEPETLNLILYANLPDGYSKSESVLAAKIFLPHMLGSVSSFATAVKEAQLLHELPHSTGQSTVYNRLPYYGEVLANYTAPVLGTPSTNHWESVYGKIGNPTVHVALNQLRAVVNTIIKDYGKLPTQIVVELTRDLKNSNEQRLEMLKRNNQREKENTRLDALLSELGVAANRSNREKLALFEELVAKTGGRDPYTGRMISQAMLFASDSPVEVEHILPYSRTFDDSINNKILAHKQANQYKGNRSPYEAWGSDSSRWAEIQTYITDLPAVKKAKFSPSAMEKYDANEGGFQARQLTDNAYISKLAHLYLKTLYNDQEGNPVWVVPGRLTAMLRRKWGLNDILDVQTEEGSTPQKNRDDHRHHAIDAAVVALTDRSLIKRISDREAAKETKRDAWNRAESPFPEPIQNLHGQVTMVAASIVTSHKLDHGTQGQLHNETSRKINALEIINEPGGHVEKAELVIDSEQKPSTLIVMRDENGDVKEAYLPDSNYCLEIYYDPKPDGAPRWQGEVIRTFAANTKPYQKFMSSERFQKETFSGKPLTMRLRKGDTVHFENDHPKYAAGYYQVLAFTLAEVGAIEIKVNPVNSASTDNSGRLKLNPLMMWSPQQVRISPSGKAYR